MHAGTANNRVMLVYLPFNNYPMKDQREKLVWIALALMIIAFAAGNVSMCLIMHAQRVKVVVNVPVPTTAASDYLSTASQIPVQDSLVIDTLHSEIRK